MNELCISPLAREDLKDIYRYIANDLENPIAARSVTSRIADDIDTLADHAYLGAPLSAIAAVNNGYRYLVSGNYMVFYRVEGDRVFVDRVLYGRRNYLRILLEIDN